MLKTSNPLQNQEGLRYFRNQKILLPALRIVVGLLHETRTQEKPHPGGRDRVPHPSEV
jgi:hypothetical protein